MIEGAEYATEFGEGFLCQLFYLCAPNLLPHSLRCDVGTNHMFALQTAFMLGSTKRMRWRETESLERRDATCSLLSPS